MYRIAVLSLLVSLPTLVQPGESGPDARARAVAPFLDEQTIAVVRVDLERLDPAAAMASVTKAGKLSAEQSQAFEETFDLARLGRRLGQLNSAGARELYLILSLIDVPQAPFVVIPVPEGADAGKIREQLAKILHQDQPGWQATLQKNVIVGGAERTLKRLRQLRPTPRPEVAAAFAASGSTTVQRTIGTRGASQREEFAASANTTIQLLFLPTGDLRRVFRELVPMLPPALGGGSSRPLTEGLRWVSLGIDLPPHQSLRLVLQSTDATVARELEALLARIARAVGRQPAVRKWLPEYDKLGRLLTTQVKEARVVVSLNDEAWEAEMPRLLTRLMKWRAQHLLNQTMKDILLAMHKYIGSNGRLPAAASFGKDGKPLLSWRVHLLPFLGQGDLYKEFRLDEPWDSAHNKKLLARMPEVYRSFNVKLNREGKTVFVLPVGPQTAFSGGPKGPRFSQDFPDGTSNTVLVVTADDAHAVPWTRPEDLRFDPERPNAGLARYPDGYLVGMADGSVRFLSATVDPKKLLPVFTPSGGEVVPADVF
jgi:hypothetical protein